MEPQFKMIPITKSKTHLRKKSIDFIKIYNKHFLRNKEDKLICDICDLVFSSKNSLRRHKVLHGEKKIKCTKCDLKFHRNDYLKRHLAKHKNSLFKCPTCSKDFSSTMDLQEHQVKAGHRNDVDKKISESENNLIKNVLNVEETLKKKNSTVKTENLTQKSIKDMQKLQWKKSQNTQHLKCNICKFKFESVQALNHHFNSRHKNLNYSCTFECGLKFSSFIELKIHQDETGHKNKYKLFTGPRTKCPECDMEFKTRIGFYGHLMNHSYFEIECSVCNMKFSMSKYLKIHQAKTGHENPIKKGNLNCTMCGRKLRTLRGLKYHLEHHDKFKFPCVDSCGMKFSKAKYLRFHQWKSGHGDPPKSFTASKQKCYLCGMNFERSKFYYKHLKNHKNFIYKCEECLLRFPMKKVLEKHLKIAEHKNNEMAYKKHFQCIECDMKFIWKIEFEQHLEEHENFKYLCDTCGMKFPRKKNLSEHKSRAHFKEFQEVLYARRMRTRSQSRARAIGEIFDDSQKTVKVHYAKSFVSDYSEVSYDDSSESSENDEETSITDSDYEEEINQSENYKSKNNKIITRNSKVLENFKTEKTFSCTKCDKIFKRLDHIKKHLKSHENFRYVCQVNGCKMRFANSVYLAEHKSRAHNET